MKQVIIAVFLMLAALAVGIICSAVTASLSREIISGLESARLQAVDENWEGAGEGIRAALDCWDSSRRILGLVAGDAELAATDAAMASVESAFERKDAGELDMHIRLAVLLVEGIREREALHWSNLG